MKKIIALLLVIGVGMTLLAGCGERSSESTTSESTTSESTTSESTTSESTTSESKTSENTTVSDIQGIGEEKTEKEQTTATILASGECGDNITWTWDDSNTLTISGAGAISDYTAGDSSDNPPPWVNFKQSMQTLVIEEGITEIGDNAFSSSGIKSLSLPDSVTKIGNYAFSCTRLTDLVIPDSVTELGEGAFINDYLENIVIGDGIEEIPTFCFRRHNTTGDSTIQSVTFGKTVRKIDDSAFYANLGNSPDLIFTGDPPDLPDDDQVYNWDGMRAIRYSTDGITLYYPKDNPAWVESGFFTYWFGNAVGY